MVRREYCPRMAPQATNIPDPTEAQRHPARVFSMNTDPIPHRLTRRHALRLALAGGASLPLSNAFAANRETFLRITPATNPTTTVLTTFSGETLTAEVATDLLVGSRGHARGFLRFTLGDGTVEYCAERGGLDFDPAGTPIRAWVLLRRRGGSGQLAQDYALASVEPAAGEDCLIYTTTGTQVGPLRFELPGLWRI